MKNIMKLVSFLSVLFIVLAGTPVSAQGSPAYKDVKTNAYYYEPLLYFDQKGWLKGYPDNTFRPHATLTREHTALLFTRTMALGTSGSKDNPFPDISSSTNKNWKEIAAVKEAGVMTGYPDGEFKPQSPITRTNMVGTITRAFDIRTVEGAKSPFTDINGQFFQKEIETLYHHKITLGREVNKFEPNGQVTRAEFVTFMHRTINFLNGLNLKLAQIENDEKDVKVTGQLEDSILNTINIEVTENTTGKKVLSEKTDINHVGNFNFTVSNLEDGLYHVEFTNNINTLMGSASFAVKEGEPTIENPGTKPGGDGNTDDKNEGEDGTNNDGNEGEDDTNNDGTDGQNNESVIDLDVLNKGLIDGGATIEDLLNNPDLLRLSLIPGNGLAVGDVVKLATDDFNLLTLTLTEDDFNRGFVDLGVKTDLLKTLTGGGDLALTTTVERTGGVIAKTVKSLKLPLLPVVEPVIDLASYTVNDLSYILSGKKPLEIDITSKGLETIKAGDTLKLTIKGGKTETITQKVTQADIDRGHMEYTFKDSNLVKRLLEGLTTGSSITITPELSNGQNTTTGEPATIEVSRGLLTSVNDLLGGLLNGLLGGLFGGILK